MADPTKAASLTATAAQAFQLTTFGDDDDASSQMFLNLAVYGPYGSGKTTLMATAADVEDMTDVLLIDIEKGKLSIKNNARIKNKGKIDVITISSFKQLGLIHDKFLKHHVRLRDSEKPEDIKALIELEAKFRGVDPKTIKTPKRYRTVILDSLTELDKMVIYELLGFSTSGDIGSYLSDSDMEVPEFAEYKKNNQMMQLIVRAFRDLAINSLFIIQEAFTKDELNRSSYTPALTGKLGKQVQGMVDIVGYLQVGSIPEGKKEAPRRLNLQPGPKFDAKNRIAHFKESFIDDPEMSDIWEAVNG